MEARLTERRRKLITMLAQKEGLYKIGRASCRERVSDYV